MMGAMGILTGGTGTASAWATLLHWAAALALLAWFASTIAQRKERPVPAKTATFEDAPRGRLERGEISPREFEDTLRMLGDS